MQTFSTPAKVNFGLRITGRRANGYHELSMINGVVSLYDRISIAVGAGDAITISCSGSVRGANGKELQSSDKNLAARAARLVLSEAHVTAAISIEIEKSIPMGGGLGGGSSNAGCILAVLPRLLAEQGLIAAEALPELKEKVLSSSVSLGADVPFFLLHSTPLSHVSGIGEGVDALPANELEGLIVWLLLPEFSVSTVEAFKVAAENPIHKTPFYDASDISTGLSREGLLAMVENGLLKSAVKIEPGIGTLLEVASRLEGFTPGMSGSGSTLFVLANNQHMEVTEVGDALREQFSGLPVQIIETNLLAKLDY